MAPRKPTYQELKDLGTRISPISDDENDPSKQPEVPAGYRLYDVYGDEGSAFVVDVTDPKDWKDSWNSYEEWGLKLGVFLISEQVLGNL